MGRRAVVVSALPGWDPSYEPGAWRPAPPAEDRAAWRAVHVQSIVDDAAKAAGRPWPELTASQYLRFRRDGNRVGYETPYFARRDRLATAVLAAAMTGDEAPLADVVDGLWLVCEESTWCLPAHERAPLPDPAAPVLDLFAAETGGLLAYADAILGERIEAAAPGVRQRLRHEARARVLAPYHDREEWWYAGDGSPLNNWNPWIHSNVLAVALLLTADASDVERTVRRVLAGLDNYLAAACPPDGGCDEGVAYWWRAGASLFECLEILHSATGGRYDPFTLPVLRRIARYPLVAHVAGDWQVNFADGAARLKPGTAAPALLYRFGRAVGDPQVVAHAVALAATTPVEPPRSPATSLARVLAALFEPVPAVAGAFPYPGQQWLPDTEVLVARERPGSSRGLFLAAKGGHNFENHNHNDVGSFIVALDGRPVLVDAGVGRYTRQTFSDRRYEIWTMRGAYHNVPEVDGREQAPGPEHRATGVAAELGADGAALRMELREAYAVEAGIRTWRRTLRLERGRRPAVVVADEWELRRPAPVALRLLAADPVDAAEPGVLRTGGLAARYDAAVFTPEVERIVLDDDELARVWGAALYRVTLSAPAGTGGAHRLIMTSERKDGS